MKNSIKLFKQAQKYIPGGVNSPVRAFSSVGTTPFFIKRAQGQYLIDEDNNQYIDFVGSWGAQILGHSDKRIIKEINKKINSGITYGAPCKDEIMLARQITKIFPSIEKIRMVNSGTEATMSAIRLARGFTKKDKVIKFDGCYHGHGDSFLIKAGSGASTFGSPNSLGVTKANAKDTISLPYNNITKVEEAIKNNNVGCIIIEPIAGNMNFIRSQKIFIKKLRTLCDKNHIILIFDEVMTGLRVAKGGAQSLYKVRPDLTTLGKVLGGGLPVGAFGGRKDIMDNLAPLGGVYQAGTLSGNPLAMAAGLKTLEIISKPRYFKELSNKAKYFISEINRISKKYKINMSADSQGGMFGIYFTKKRVNNYNDILNTQEDRFVDFFQYMLKHGVFFAPSMFEAGFISSSHTKKDIDYTIKIYEKWVKNTSLSAD
ncbi:MAG: glutamate-1-semialdehyde 2,1-aminomutase [Gammaproteobacteria bacterium]|nr:glutamate-1-semialdehyde 2,1-aminomutase [Gammaproteobacteria bacterium]MBT4462207.1 glutamate-1-semialdehyde 2,1-aminomutase [Gammaproteobacteria bacterium]MBT4654453.1 glutamate-1-semialdehyde 2,1-aminomutase [Gammaproteobacteria bacterium]MBT5116865.1 glutamate-1-semialdehyde 2,1-aminomutase [Gammaproteobacteria bacterium]MBT5761951.1 glutamate-1-semialdehyde 2,1-aminomutase [Gammaproteobacteria bacterium]